MSGIGPDYNRSAVDAISERVAEVTALAEQLDAALCTSHDIGDISDILESSPTQEDWYGSLDKSSSSSGTLRSGGESSATKLSCGEEDEFVTASDCTCTPPSRSSSFHTASEGETSYATLWWQDKSPPPQEFAELIEVTDTTRLRFSKDECVTSRERTSTSQRSLAPLTSTPLAELPTKDDAPSSDEIDVELGGAAPESPLDRSPPPPPPLPPTMMTTPMNNPTPLANRRLDEVRQPLKRPLIQGIAKRALTGVF